jgi:hypothetical protein
MCNGFFLGVAADLAWPPAPASGNSLKALDSLENRDSRSIQLKTPTSLSDDDMESLSSSTPKRCPK